MLFLLFQLGSERYALDVHEVAEVLPLVSIKPIPQAPAGIAGVFNYRGTAVPVVDLSALMLGAPARVRLSTRLVLVHQTGSSGEGRLLGLIAESATKTLRRDAADFAPSGVSPPGTPYLGPVTTGADGIIQWITAAKLLSPAVKEVLFRSPEVAV